MKQPPPSHLGEYDEALDTLFTAQETCGVHLTAGRMRLLMFLVEAARRKEPVDDTLITAVQSKGLLSRRFRGRVDRDKTAEEMRREFSVVQKEASITPDGANGRSLGGRLRDDLDRVYLQFETHLEPGTPYTAFAIAKRGDPQREIGSPYSIHLMQRIVEARMKPLEEPAVKSPSGLQSVLDDQLLRALEQLLMEPLASRLVAVNLGELRNGRFRLYLPERIYQHDTQALRLLSPGESYLATHPTYANPGASRSGTYENYVRAQCEAAEEGGVRVSRIYIDDGRGALEVDSMRAEMTRLKKSGVMVRVASIDQLDRQYHDDFVLIGTRMLGLGWPPRGPMQFSSYDVADKNAISEYLHYFESLERVSVMFVDSPSRYETAAYHEVTSVRIEERPSRRLMVVLRTNGCSYDQNKKGCRMCDFKAHAVDASVHRVTASDLSRQLAQVLDTELDETVEEVDLLTLGNFLYPGEVPEAFQYSSLQQVQKLQSVRKVVIESRCSYVTADNLKKLRSLLRPDQILELGVGVESSNPFIRNNVLNKNLEWSVLKSTMIKARDADVAFMAYLLIKPQTLSEREAIDDAVQSAKDVARLASECRVKLRIAFEPVFVTQHTDLEQQFVHFQNYELLNLWSVIEVLKRTAAELDDLPGGRDVTLFVGLSDENLSGDRKPRSCDLCNATLTQAIHEYNATNSVEAFADLPTCCFPEWAKKVGNTHGVRITPQF